jgi:hypothetical protein
MKFIQNLSEQNNVVIFRSHLGEDSYPKLKIHMVTEESMSETRRNGLLALTSNTGRGGCCEHTADIQAL